MKRVFVDTSVFFAACYSQTGASFEIFRLALNEALQLITSDYVLEETRRNLAAKSAEDIVRFWDFLDLLEFDKANPSVKDVLEAAQYTDAKDAPVVAAARQAGADYLVSLDRRHLVGQPVVAQRAGLKIVLPEVLLREIRGVQ
jgi:putative PIN family toxin of toxin-antitoxin system